MARRVILEVEGSDIRLVESTHVDMPAPGQPAPPSGSGLYAELRDGDDAMLYRQSLSPQLQAGAEVFGEDGSPRRMDVGERARTVMLVLPDEPAARSLVFLRGGTPRKGRGVRTQAIDEPEELKRFDWDAS